MSELVDQLVTELLNEYTRMERKATEAELRFRQIQRRLREVEKSRDKWKEEARGLKFQLGQKLHR